MRDSCNITIKRFLANQEIPDKELVEVVEIVGLPGDYDFDSLQEYLESSEGEDITNSYYKLERIYTREEMGAGGSAEELILKVWNSIPEEIKRVFIEKVISLCFSIPEKIKQIKRNDKLPSSEVEYIKTRYGFSPDISEVVEIEKTEIKIKTYRKY